jgi:hypothetical protein
MEAVPTDTVPEWRLPRYRVRVYEPFSEDLLEVTTLVEPSVRMIRRYSIPGRMETIGVLSFRGIPHEAGYEVQIPILLSKPRETPRSGPRPVRRIDSVLP